MGCIAVPKKDPNKEMVTLSWRLSFSEAELLLAKEVSDHLGNSEYVTPAVFKICLSRLAYLTVKLFYTQKVKPVCHNIRSYHIHCSTTSWSAS